MHIQHVNIVHHPRMMKRSQNKTSILVNFVYNQKSGIIKSRLQEFWSIWLCLCTHFDTIYLAEFENHITTKTTKPYSTMRGSLHGSNYDIMFYHKPSPCNPTYVSLAIHSRSQARVKGEGCVRPRQPT